jgi:hypothetical protein
VPRKDIYVRYLSDNRTVIADLAAELYGRKIKVEVASADMRASEASPEPMVAGEAVAKVDRDDGGEQVDAAARAEVSGNTVQRTAAEAREALYSDPVVRRIFNEFEARLVEVRAGPSRAAADSKK